MINAVPATVARRAALGDPKKDADHVFYELTRTMCPTCRRITDGHVLIRAGKVYLGLLGLELLAGLKKLELPGVDMTQAKQFARSAMKAIQEGIFGYALIIASRTFGQEASR